MEEYEDNEELELDPEETFDQDGDDAELEEPQDNVVDAVSAFLARDPTGFQDSISAELDQRIQSSLDFQKSQLANNMVNPADWQVAADEQEEEPE